MSLGDEAIGKSRDITDGCLWKQFLKGYGIGALVEDDNVPMMNEEGTCRGKIAGFDNGKSIVEELVLLRQLGIEWRDLEDERDSGWKRVAGRGNPRRRSLIFRSIG
jgi:hypothetical protein